MEDALPSASRTPAPLHNLTNKERKAIRTAAREGDMVETPGEPARAMPGVADSQYLRAREGDTPSAWRVALSGSFFCGRRNRGHRPTGAHPRITPCRPHGLAVRMVFADLCEVRPHGPAVRMALRLFAVLCVRIAVRMALRTLCVRNATKKPRLGLSRGFLLGRGLFYLRSHHTGRVQTCSWLNQPGAPPVRS